jgi:hypothetical protein
LFCHPKYTEIPAKTPIIKVKIRERLLARSLTLFRTNGSLLSLGPQPVKSVRARVEASRILDLNDPHGFVHMRALNTFPRAKAGNRIAEGFMACFN